MTIEERTRMFRQFFLRTDPELKAALGAVMIREALQTRSDLLNNRYVALEISRTIETLKALETTHGR